MCGRFALTLPREAVSEIFSATPVEGLSPAPPRYNIRPTQEIDVIRWTEDGREHLRMRWGFLPHWYKKPNDGPLLINARSETIHQKPAFRTSCQDRRCLIPASGFYEWMAGEDGGRQPYYIHPADDGLAAFAGVWREWTGEDGMRLLTCAIVTCGASERLSVIHNRMPVTIAPEDFGLWLGEEGKGAAVLMRPAPEDFYAFHPVSRAVNKGGTDGAELIAPLE